MGDRPESWDPARPTPFVCVFCYDKAKLAFAWKFGANYTCYRGNCLAITKGVVGFIGVYPDIHLAAAAVFAKATQQKERAVRGKGRVDSRRQSLRAQDNA